MEQESPKKKPDNVFIIIIKALCTAFFILVGTAGLLMTVCGLFFISEVFDMQIVPLSILGGIVIISFAVMMIKFINK